MKFTLLAVLILAWMMWIGLLFFGPSISDQTTRELVDFDLNFYNVYDLPVDQLSVEIKSTGEIFVADVVYDPYIIPDASGLFSAILEQDEYDEAIKGFQVISVRTR